MFDNKLYWKQEIINKWMDKWMKEQMNEWLDKHTIDVIN